MSVYKHLQYLFLVTVALFFATVTNAGCPWLEPSQNPNTPWLKTNYQASNLNTLSELSKDLERLESWARAGQQPYASVLTEIQHLRSQVESMKTRGFSEVEFLPLVSRYVELVDLRMPTGRLLNGTSAQRVSIFLQKSNPLTLAGEIEKSSRKMRTVLTNRQKTQIVYHWGGATATERQILDALSILKPLVALKADPPFDYDGFKIESLIELAWHDVIHFEKLIGVLGNQKGPYFGRDYNVNILRHSVMILRRMLLEINSYADAEKREILTLVLFHVLHEADLNVFPMPHDNNKSVTYFADQDLLRTLPKSIGDKIASGFYGNNRQLTFAGREAVEVQWALSVLKEVGEKEEHRLVNIKF